jgi:hypothetical protein
VHRLLLATAAVVALAVSPARAGTGTPSARGPLVTGLTFDWATYRRLAQGSDNWATTWATDGSLYTSFGDGDGFEGGRQSLGFARLGGSSAQTVHGTDLPGAPVAAGKTYGVLALGGFLYTFVSPGSNAANYQEARLYRAPLGGAAWTRAGWAFTGGGPERIILPTFLQAGRDYAAGGRYVYAYAPRYAPTGPGRLSVQRGTGLDGITLLRAPRGGLMDRARWRYFAGLPAALVAGTARGAGRRPARGGPCPLLHVPSVRPARGGARRGGAGGGLMRLSSGCLEPRPGRACGRAGRPRARPRAVARGR